METTNTTNRFATKLVRLLLFLAVCCLLVPNVHASTLITNESPATQIIGVGSNATFFVQADSNFSPLSYHWQFNGTDIPAATNSTLTVSNVTYANDGCYTAFVAGNGLSQTSSCMQLVSMDLAKALNATNMTWTTIGPLSWEWETNMTVDDAGVVSDQPDPINWIHTNSIQTTVVGPGTVDFWWVMSESTPGLDSQTFTVNGSTVATFSAVTTWTHSGPYYLDSGTNTLGWTYKGYTYAFLDEVTFTPGGVPPTITTAPADQTVSAGATLTLTAAASGAPPLQYQWQLAGANISDATNSFLTVSNAQSANAGLYTITVTNGYGGTNASVNVTVTPAALRFTHQPTSTNVLLGTTARLFATIQGSEPFTCQWLFNGTAIPNATNLSLNITNVATGDAGSYQIAVTNDLGGILSTNVILCAGHTIVVGWGNGQYAGNSAPVGLTNAVQVCVNNYAGFALKSDGRVAAWGLNNYNLVSSCTNLSNIIAIACSPAGALALQSDGTVVAWGYNYFNATNVPPGLSNVVAIAAGTYFNMALQNDGHVVCWGENSSGQTNVPPSATNIVAIAAANLHAMALRRDGTVVVWGSQGLTNVPAKVTNIIGIAASQNSCFAIRNDRTIMAWGNSGETNVPPGTANIFQLAEGTYHNLALKNDGTVVAWLYNDGSGYNYGQANVPLSVSNVISIAAGYTVSYAVVSDTPPQPQATFTGLLKTDSIFQGGLPTRNGRVYSLEYTDAFPPTWQPLSILPGTGANEVFTDPAATNTSRFYRVREW